MVLAVGCDKRASRASSKAATADAGVVAPIATATVADDSIITLPADGGLRPDAQRYREARNAMGSMGKDGLSDDRPVENAVGFGYKIAPSGIIYGGDPWPAEARSETDVAGLAHDLSFDPTQLGVPDDPTGRGVGLLLGRISLEP